MEVQVRRLIQAVHQGQVHLVAGPEPQRRRHVGTVVGQGPQPAAGQFDLAPLHHESHPKDALPADVLRRVVERFGRRL